MADKRQIDTGSSLIYKGQSMNPTFRDGDLLFIAPYLSHQKVHVGDVVVFRTSEHKNDYVVHRVVHVGPNWVRTQGDNNPAPDPYLVSYDDIVGRVKCLQRGVRKLNVHGGFRGRLFITMIRLGRPIWMFVTSLFKPFYRPIIRHNGSYERLLRWMRIRVISFKDVEGTELQLLMGRHVIGRKLPNERRWWIRKPFRLFIDEAKLLRIKDIQPGTP